VSAGYEVERYMLNYEEELKKFKPCLSVDEVEDAIYEKDLTDVIDLLKEMQNSKNVDTEGAGQ
jgi:hypothetical protein